MLWFSHPSGWWALLSLTLPLVLHLWRPPARKVLLGSLRFLEGLPRRNLRNLRWRETLLLWTRLLLLGMLTWLLAGPGWSRRTPAQPRRWVLLAPDAAVEGAARDRLDTLQNEGYEIHLLAAGFPGAGGRAVPGDPAVASPDVWSLLREADAVLPVHSRIAVFTPDRVAGLRGARPAMHHCQIEWVKAAMHPEEVQPWISSLETVGSGNTQRLNLRFGMTSSASTRFVSQVLPALAGRTQMTNPPDRWEVEVSKAGDTGFVAHLMTAAGQPIGGLVTAQSVAPLVAWILHEPGRSEDARYVEAAIRAAAQEKEREIRVVRRQSDRMATPEEPKPQWVFWLSSQTVPDSISRLAGAGGRLLTDAPAPDTQRVESRIITPQTSLVLVNLSRRVDAPVDTTTVWTDGFGQPLLTWSILGQGEHWSFLSRFHPAWSDLPRTGSLAAVFESLLNEPPDRPDTAAAPDLRAAGTDQGLPKVVEPAADAVGATPATGAWTDLSGWFWGFAVLCFCLERFLSSLPATASRIGVTEGARP